MTDVFLYAGQVRPNDVQLLDPTTISVSVVAFSAAVTEGADVLTSQVDPAVASSVAVTEGADVLVGAVDPLTASTAFSAAVTEGSDVLAGNSSVLIAHSAAITEPADVGSGIVAPIVASSAAITEGADVLVAADSILVSISDANTDGADVLTSVVGPVVALSVGVIEGADVLVSSVDPLTSSVSFSVSVTDGADVLTAATDVVSVVPIPHGFGESVPVFRRWKTKAQIRQQRLDLGIIPEAVAEIAVKVAKKAIKRATVERQPDVVEWVQDDAQQALYERQMRMELARHQQVWNAAYSKLFELAVIESLQQEEEVILMLMHEL